MNVVITIIKMVFLFVSIILLVASCIRLYRWRKSAFDSTTAYLRNLRYIHPGEKVCIQAPDDTVEGIQYCKSYFHEDDKAKLPSKIRIYYNRKTPKIMYREGAVRDGVIISVASITLSAIFLFAVVASYIW